MSETAAIQEVRKNNGFLHAFFGGKLRPHRDAWAQARGCARPHVRVQPRRGTPSPTPKKFCEQSRKTVWPLACKIFSPMGFPGSRGAVARPRPQLGAVPDSDTGRRCSHPLPRPPGGPGGPEKMGGGLSLAPVSARHAGRRNGQERPREAQAMPCPPSRRGWPPMGSGASVHAGRLPLEAMAGAAAQNERALK